MIPLATKLFGSQLCTGRQARPQPYGARYNRTPRRSLRVALAIKILFLPPWVLLSLVPRLRALVSFSISSFSTSTSAPPSASPFLPPTLSSLRRRLSLSRYPTRYALAIKSARSPRTFTRSLTPGSAGVKGTDVLA